MSQTIVIAKIYIFFRHYQLYNLFKIIEKIFFVEKVNEFNKILIIFKFFFSRFETFINTLNALIE